MTKQQYYQAGAKVLPNAPSLKRERRLCPAAEALASLFERISRPEQQRLTALWRAWPKIMDAPVGELGVPLGQKERVLLIGAEDTMALQELSMLAYDILEQANAFMGEAFFVQVRVTLMQGRSDLAEKRPPRPVPVAPPSSIRLPVIGALAGKLDPASPITRCYETVVAQAAKGALQKKGG